MLEREPSFANSSSNESSPVTQYEKYWFVGDVLTPEKIEEAKTTIHKIGEDRGQKVEGEEGKTERDRALIQKSQDNIARLFERIGLSTPDPISLDRFHMLSENVFVQRYPGGDAKDVNGFQDYGSVFIKEQKPQEEFITETSKLRAVAVEMEQRSTMSSQEEESLDEAGIFHERTLEYQKAVEKELRENLDKKMDARRLATIIHESLHAYQSEGYRYHKENDSITLTRQGYVSFATGMPLDAKTRVYPEHFNSLNEAMTERMTIETVGEEYPNASYIQDMILLDAIIDKVAAGLNESRDVYWKRLQQGYFTGDLRALKEMQKVLGSATVRLYASVSSTTPEASKYMHRYLQEEDPVKKQEIAEKIFSLGTDKEFMQHEKEKYLRLIKNANQTGL